VTDTEVYHATDQNQQTTFDRRGRPPPGTPGKQERRCLQSVLDVRGEGDVGDARVGPHAARLLVRNASEVPTVPVHSRAWPVDGGVHPHDGPAAAAVEEHGRGNMRPRTEP
jgi:hypothetical protein